MSSFLPAAPEQGKPKLLDRVRQLMRLRHYSLRTEEAYVGWIRRYILFHGKRHPNELDEQHVSQFLTSLAIKTAVSPLPLKTRRSTRSCSCTKKYYSVSSGLSGTLCG